MKIKITTEVEIGLEDAAKWFSELDDDAQARFFVAVGRHAAKWGDGWAEAQWFSVGSHIKNCECSSLEARQFVLELHNGFENGKH